MIFTGTAVTSDPFYVGAQAVTPAYLTVTGPADAKVYLDVMHNGQLTAFSETTFTGPTAQRVDLRRGECRVRIVAATAATVELTW